MRVHCNDHLPLSQIDPTTLREVCSKYGMVRVCHTDHPSELALICFNNIDEAIQAKTALDKTPSISGVSVMAQFASEGDIKELCEQFQLSHDAAAVKREEDRASAHTWPGRSSSETKLSQPTSATPTPSSLALSAVAAASWDNHTPSPAQFSRQQSSEVGTPGSMWSEGGFLSGFSSPWLSTASAGSGSSSAGGTSGGPCSMTSPQENASSGMNANLPGNCAGQSFLPGGLL